MAIHSSVLAWRIPWTEEPGGLHLSSVTRPCHPDGPSHPSRLPAHFTFKSSYCPCAHAHTIVFHCGFEFYK